MPAASLFFYTLLLIYGTLFPLSGWEWPSNSLLNPLYPPWPQKLHTSDVITNLLIYIPFGFLLALIVNRYCQFLLLLLLVTALGTGLSFLLEYLQTYLPTRVTSLADILLNGLGSFLGASLIILVSPSSSLHKKLRSLKQYWFKDGTVTHIGLFVLGMWAVSQLFPLVPSLDVASLRAGLRPLWHTLNDFSLFDPWHAATYTLNITGLGLLAATLFRENRRVLPLFTVFIIAVLFLKIPVVGRQLSAESISGLFVSVFSLAVILALCSGSVSSRGFGRSGQGFNPGFNQGMAALCLCSAFLLEALQTGSSAVTKGINWIPFLGHMKSIMDMVDLVATAWPFAALAYLALSFAPPNAKPVAISGAILIAITTLVVEWLQQSLPGRYPDITDVVIATLGWSLPWVYLSAITKSGLKGQTKAPPNPKYP